MDRYGEMKKKELSPEGKERRSGILAPVILLFLGGATFLAYSGSLENPFHYDDLHSILNNFHIRKLENIPRFFVDPRLFDAYPENSMYRPLLLFTYALNHHFGGYAPLGFHLVNLGLHLGCTYLLFGIAWLLYPVSFKKASGMLRWIFAGTTAMIFALQPVHCESINYISARSSVLATFFFLASFLLYLLFREVRSKGSVLVFYFLSLLAFLGGLLSKSIAATLPLILVLCEFIFPRFRRRRWASILPFVLFTGAYLWVRKVLMGTAVISFGARLTRGADLFSGGERDILSNLLTQSKVFWRYLGLLLVPRGLSVDHFVPIETNFTPPVIFSLLGIAALLVAGAAIRKKLSLATFGFLWMGITLLPTSSIIPLNVIMNEHRLYLPSVGFFLILGLLPLGIFRVSKGGAKGKPEREKLSLVASLAVPALLFAAYLPLTMDRCGVWKNELTLWEDAVKKSPSSFRARVGLGNAYAMIGDTERAIEEYTQSLSLYPEFVDARINLGEAFNQLGLKSGAEEDFARGEKEYLAVLEKAPGNTLVKLKLGALYRNMARKLGRKEKSEQARSLYMEILEKNPNNFYACKGMADLLLEEGKRAEGIAALKELIQRFPSERSLRYRLVEALADAGEIRGALLCCQEILSQDPFDSKAHSLMAVLYRKEGLNNKVLATVHQKISEAMK